MGMGVGMGMGIAFDEADSDTEVGQAAIAVAPVELLGLVARGDCRYHYCGRRRELVL